MGNPDNDQWSEDDLKGASAHEYEQDPETIPDQPEQEEGGDDQLPIYTD